MIFIKISKTRGPSRGPSWGPLPSERTCCCQSYIQLGSQFQTDRCSLNVLMSSLINGNGDWNDPHSCVLFVKNL